MNRPLLKRVFPQVLVWAGVVALCSLSALAQDPAPASAASQRSDGQIEMDVVHALDASKALKKDLITAATIQGEVTLSGTVSSDASSELAESIASGVQGVAKVHNNLKVGNPSAPDAALAGDPNAQQMADDAQPGGPALAPPSASDGPMAVPNRPQDQSRDQADQAPVPPPPARPQYAPVRPPSQARVYEAPKGPVTIPEGTLLQVRTSESVSSKNAKDGTPVQFIVIHDVNFGGVLAIPRGATVHGVVSEVKKNGDMGGSAELALKLTSIDLGGQNYPVESDQFKVKGPNKAGRTAGSAFGGALLGAMIGGIADRGFGAAVGAAAGAGAGTVASSAAPGPGVWIPSEALVDFHLAKPLTVTPVSSQEAARLAQGLYPGGPSLYRRAYAPYGYPYGRPYYYYTYPPVYYRPYYAVGGYYYWR
jgi:hypothetical protein